MNKKTLITSFIVVVTLILGTTIFIFGGIPKHTDQCTRMDREQNMCVPAGRCTIPGDLREVIVDCEIKDYDHKSKI